MTHNDISPRDTVKETIQGVEKLSIDPCSSSADTSQHPFVSFSVQGTVFLLKRDFVVSHEWLLATMLESEIPVDRLNGHLYLDVDPPSFRMIVSILRGVTHVNDAKRFFSDLELALLVSTAEYLSCEKLTEQFKTVRSTQQEEHFRQQEECRQLQKQIRTQALELKSLNEENVRYDRLQEAIDAGSVEKLVCCGYRTCRPHNRCGCTYIIMGDCKIDKSTIRCGDCESVGSFMCKTFNKSGTSLSKLERALGLP